MKKTKGVRRNYGQWLKKQRRAGNRIDCHLALDTEGRFWWADAPPGVDPRTRPLHGPFRSEAEAEEDFRVTVLGPQCEVTEGGTWDPKWDEKQ
jgi:hypothetical protein